MSVSVQLKGFLTSPSTALCVRFTVGNNTNGLEIGEKAKTLGLGQIRSTWEQCSLCTILCALCNAAYGASFPNGYKQQLCQFR